MVDMCVNPGMPKPWTFHQEIAGLRPRLISRPSSTSFQLALEKQYSLDASGKPLASKYLDSSTKPSSSSTCLHSRSPSLKSLRTLSSSPDSSESGSSMDHPLRINMMPRYTSSPQLLHQARMSSNTRFMDHTIGFTNSNAGNICGEPECTEKACESQPYTSDPYIERQLYRMPLADMSWPSKSMSFMTEAEETPSPSSSYDTMDMLKDDPHTMWDPTNNCAYASSNTRSTSYTTSLQGGRYQLYEIPRSYNGYTPFPSSGWSSDITPFPQPYIADTMVEPYVEYQDSINYDWKIGHETQLHKTFSPPLPLRTMTYRQQPYSQLFPSTLPTNTFPTTTLAQIPPELDLKQIIMSSNYPLPDPANPDPNQGFTYFGGYPGDIAGVAQPNAMTMAAHQNQYMQSPAMPDLVHPQPQCAPQPASQPASQPQLSSQPQLGTQVSLAAAPHATDLQNAFLIEGKEKGLSYKEIKRLGNFKEAESTLRGRYRTLTKRKEERVRKPKWTERDVSSSFSFSYFYAQSLRRQHLPLLSLPPPPHNLFLSFLSQSRAFTRR